MGTRVSRTSIVFAAFVWVGYLAGLSSAVGQLMPRAGSSKAAATDGTPHDTARSPIPVPPIPAPKKEDWTVLPVAQSGIDTNAIGGVQLSKVEEAEFTREIVRVQWRAGDPIDLYVVLPHGVTRPPVILYLYDYRYDTDRFRDAGWCKRATQKGFAAVGFVSAVSGPRAHSPRPMKEWFVSDLQEALGSSTHDVQMVLNYLQSRADLDMDRVGMFAQGSGGAIAILTAAVDPRIRALDLLNPWGDWPDWLRDSRQVPDEERADYLKPEFLQGVAKLDPVTYLPHLHLKGLRIQEVMDDQVTPASARAKISASAPAANDVVSYKDTAAHIAAWRSSGLTGWLGAQLQPRAEVVAKQ